MENMDEVPDTQNSPDKGRLPSPLPPLSGWPSEADLTEYIRYDPTILWPRISITVPSYNQGNFLEATLRSVLLQGYPNLELFVMDGGSTDQSVDILKKYSPWITSWVSQPDRGQSHAINCGWRQSSGEIIAYLNSDDFYMPGALLAVARSWLQQPNSAVFAGGIRYVDGSGRMLSEKMAHLYLPLGADLSTADISAWFLPQQACFFSRQYLDQVGFWLREDLHYVMDRELIYRLAHSGPIWIVPEVLAADRKHELAKRQKFRLAMAREDRLALAYCQWGSRADEKKRKKIARARLAQGYWFASETGDTRLTKAILKLKAVMLRPAYLQRWRGGRAIFDFGRSFRARLVHFVKGINS